MNSAKKHLNHLLLTLLALVAVFLVTGIYLYAFDQNPATVITNSPMPVDRAVYRAGDPILATIEYCRYTKVPFTTYISFSDTLIFDIPPREAVGAPVGCGTVQGKLAVTPDNLPPGNYHLVGKNVYQVNFMAFRVTDWYTVEFEVVK